MSLREARLRRGLRACDLAVLADLTPSYVSALETGALRLTPTAAARLAPLLGVDANALLVGQERVRAQRRQTLGAGIGVGASA